MNDGFLYVLFTPDAGTCVLQWRRGGSIRYALGKRPQGIDLETAIPEETLAVVQQLRAGFTYYEGLGRALALVAEAALGNVEKQNGRKGIARLTADYLALDISSLELRTHACPRCGWSCARDQNAARNILAAGLSAPAAGASAVGSGDVRRAQMHAVSA